MDDRSINRQTREPGVDPKDILRYVSGQMGDEEARQLEARALEDPFLADAIEGAENAGDKVRLEQMAYSLNQDLKRRLAQKKQRRQWIGFKAPAWWPWLTLILLLLLTLSYLFIRKLSG